MTCGICGADMLEVSTIRDEGCNRAVPAKRGEGSIQHASLSLISRSRRQATLKAAMAVQPLA